MILCAKEIKKLDIPELREYKNKHPEVKNEDTNGVIPKYVLPIALHKNRAFEIKFTRTCKKLIKVCATDALISMRFSPLTKTNLGGIWCESMNTSSLNEIKCFSFD